MLMVWALQASAADRVSMQPIHHFRKGVAAWVLIASPRTEAERRIRGHLARLNASSASMLRECDKNYAENMREDFGKERMGGEFAKRWDRKVEITMQGPAYLSEIATDTFFCGARILTPSRTPLSLILKPANPSIP